MLSKSYTIASALILFNLVACSSAPKDTAKTTEQTTTTTAVQTADNKTVVAADKVDKKKSVKKTEVTASSEANTCASGSDKRVLEIKKNESGGCEVHYGKDGAATKVADQISGTTHCEDVKGKIKAKLEASGFTCS